MNLEPNSEDDLRQHQYRDASNLKARIRLHKLFTIAAESWEDFMLSNLHLLSEETVLELGCGNASQTRHNRYAYPTSLHYFLSDFSFGMMQEAILEMQDDARFTFSVQDAQALAFPDSSFDCVTANHMLYHVPDIQIALLEVYRLLKPGGRLIAATNGQDHMWDLDQLLQSVLPGNTPWHSFHSRFTLESGASLITSVFGNCRKILYPSELWVTEAKPLADYVISLAGIDDNPTHMTSEELTRNFQRLIDLQGGIRIRKSSGLLLTIKQPLSV